MSPQEIYSPFIQEAKKILHVSEFQTDIRNFLPSETELTTLGSFETADIPAELSDLDTYRNIVDQYDFIVLDEILETVKDPVSIIQILKNKTKNLLVYEFKYLEMEQKDVKSSWNCPWKTVGLEFVLSREFDFLNSIFLGYATIHLCKIPYNEKIEENVFR